MKSNYNQLGQYIEMVSRTNSDLKYGIEDVRGCSNTKQMMQTRANLIGRTYEKFIVLRPQEFVFNRRTTRNGEKIGMAYNNTDREYIFTNDYVAFRVKQEYLDKLLPDYLYMFFCRDEFDRYARYKSTGSATEFFNWEDMCAVPFEIPPMDFQQLVVNAYKVLNERIETKQKINDNLAEYLNCIYIKLTKDMQTTTSLSKICDYVTEKVFFSEVDTSVYISTENILPDKQGIASFGMTSPSDRVTYFRERDVIVSNIRPYFKKMWFATTSGGCNADVLCFRALDKRYSYLLKSILFQDSFFDYVMSGAKGTKMPRGDKKHIMQYQIPCFLDTQLQKFNELASSIEHNQALNRQEISALESAKEILLTTLSR